MTKLKNRNKILFSLCLLLLLSPAHLSAQKDSLAKPSDITGFRISNPAGYADRYRKDTIIYLYNQPEDFFEKLKVISLNEALKIARTKKHFKKEIDDFPYLDLTDNLNPCWTFNSTRDIIYINKLRVREFYISIDAKTGKVKRKSAERYWFKSPTHYDIK